MTTTNNIIESIDTFEDVKLLSSSVSDYYEVKSENGNTMVMGEVPVAVSSKQKYACNVELSLDSANKTKIESFTCECANKYEESICRHCAALLIKHLNNEASTNSNKHHKFKLNLANEEEIKYSSPEIRREVLNNQNPMYCNCLSQEHNSLSLIPELKYAFNNNLNLTCYVRLLIYINKRWHIIYDTNEFLNAIDMNMRYSISKDVSIDQNLEMYDERSRILLDIIKDNNQNAIYSRSSIIKSKAKDFIELSFLSVPDILNVYVGENIKVQGNRYLVTDAEPDINVNVWKKGTGWQMSITRFSEIVGSRRCWLADTSALYKCSDGQSKELIPLLRRLEVIESIGHGSVAGNAIFTLENSDFYRFFYKEIDVLEKYCNLQISDIDVSKLKHPNIFFKFYLSDFIDLPVTLSAKAVYDNATYDLFEPADTARVNSVENKIRKFVVRYFFMDQDGIMKIEDEETLFRFLVGGLEEMHKMGEVFKEGDPSNYKAASFTPSLSVGFQNDFLSFSIKDPNFTKAELNEIMRRYINKKEFCRLESGKYVDLRNLPIGTNPSILKEAIFQKDHSTDSVTALLPKASAFEINEWMFGFQNMISIEKSKDYEDMINGVRNFKDEDIVVPSTINANLRKYQTEGYKWLVSLATNGLGGILADDMGLGKTLQVICLLEYMQYKNVLIVCPSSLVLNWGDEILKFCPSLKFETLNGDQESRVAKIGDDSEIYITSYKTLLLDFEYYKDIKFNCCVFDEAQYVKNPFTKSATCLRDLKSDASFALTGTPIENSLADMWSIFDLVLPGYLGTYRNFSTEYIAPIMEGGDKYVMARLQKKISPFVLRRCKKDVLSELPGRQVEVVKVDMTGEQKKLYTAFEYSIKNKLNELLSSTGKANRIQVFRLLMILRQLCCCPSLVKDNYCGGSGKVNKCLSMLRDYVNDGHKVLVFSQFTSMLNILQQALSKANIKHQCLQGSTTQKARKQMVDKFQNGEIPVFFISLRAGGTGLNLTKADRVIIFDPWWNPAVENQAFDRAHRIGQKNNVVMSKLVCADSIEERIVDLQQSKQELANSLLSEKSFASGKFDPEEILELFEDE